MPRKVTTRRQRKAAAAKKQAEKGPQQKNQPAKPSTSNPEPRVIIDENVAKHIQPPPTVSPPEVAAITSKDDLVKKKGDKGEEAKTRYERELGNALDKIPDTTKCYEEDGDKSSLSGLSSMDPEELLEKICEDLKDILTTSDEEEAKSGELPPGADCSTSAGLVRDSAPVPPKFFGNTGYFMLTGTNSQLIQQLKDLAAKNITLESHVLLPNAVADIVEHQMTELVMNRQQILDKIQNKYALISQRRVPRQKKQRKFPKKTSDD